MSTRNNQPPLHRPVSRVATPTRTGQGLSPLGRYTGAMRSPTTLLSPRSQGAFAAAVPILGRGAGSQSHATAPSPAVRPTARVLELSAPQHQDSPTTATRKRGSAKRLRERQAAAEEVSARDAAHTHREEAAAHEHQQATQDDLSTEEQDPAHYHRSPVDNGAVRDYHASPSLSAKKRRRRAIRAAEQRAAKVISQRPAADRPAESDLEDTVSEEEDAYNGTPTRKRAAPVSDFDSDLGSDEERSDDNGRARVRQLPPSSLPRGRAPITAQTQRLVEQRSPKASAGAPRSPGHLKRRPAEEQHRRSNWVAARDQTKPTSAERHYNLQRYDNRMRGEAAEAEADRLQAEADRRQLEAAGTAALAVAAQQAGVPVGQAVTPIQLFTSLMQMKEVLSPEVVGAACDQIPGLADTLVQMARIAGTSAGISVDIDAEFKRMDAQSRTGWNQVTGAITAAGDNAAKVKLLKLMAITFLTAALTRALKWVVGAWQFISPTKGLPADGGIQLAWMVCSQDARVRKLDPHGAVFVKAWHWWLSDTSGNKQSTAYLGLRQRLLRLETLNESDAGGVMRNCMFELTLADLQTRVATNAEEQMLINEAKVAFEVVKDSRSVTDDVDAVAGRPTLSEATLTIGFWIKKMLGPTASMHEHGNFMRSLTDVWGNTIFNRAIIRTAHLRLNKPAYSLWWINFEMGPGMGCAMPVMLGTKDVLDGVWFSRALVERLGLQTEKMCLGEVGPGIGESFGTKNNNKVYTPFNSAVSVRSPDSRCYLFTEQVELQNGLILCPTHLRVVPPALILELMGVVPAGPANTSAVSLLQELQQLRASPRKKVVVRRPRCGRN